MFATLEAKVLGSIALMAMIAAAFGAYTIHERDYEHAKDMATFKKSSDAAIARADAQIAQLTKQHSQFVIDSQEKFDAQEKSIATLTASDSDRVRQLDAYRRAHPAVQSAPGGAGTASGGNSNASGIDSSIERLEQVAIGLNSADLNAQNSLLTCMKERDSLAK